MQPSLFISHGSPMIAIEDQPVRRFLVDLGRQLIEPAAILVVSAHYEATHPILTAVERPGTIHDFGGFPRDLYELRYPAPGEPELADRIAESLRSEGFDADTSSRGLDHGAWIPLLLMYPDANIPVIELSVMPERTPADHYALGQALRELRRQNVLILGSGGATHNLRAYFGRGHAGSGTEPAWLAPFEDWLANRLRAGEIEDLLDYRARAPGAREAHPTEEHILPLFVALGAGDQPAVGRRIHRGRDRVLTMDAFQFSAEPDVRP